MAEHRLSSTPAQQHPSHPLRSLLAVLAMAVTALVVVHPAPASAEPDLDKVKAKVEKLQHQAEIASERFNDARVRAIQVKTTLDALNADLKRQQKVVDKLRLQVATSVVAEYQGNALSAPSQMMLSQDPDAFLDNLNAVSSYNTQQGQVVDDYNVEIKRLQLRQDAVEQEAKRFTGLQRKMLKQKEQIDERTAEAKEVLDGLEAKARAALLSGRYTGNIPDVAASGRAKAAIDYALAQVGKAYVYGAAGPNAFDCSGLTMRAWGAAGVGLPHSSRAQQGSGRSIPASQLQPGDLVFYYSPVSHVGMYIGHGMIVEAANPSAGVRVSPLYSMPYSGAVRLG